MADTQRRYQLLADYYVLIDTGYAALLDKKTQQLFFLRETIALLRDIQGNGISVGLHSNLAQVLTLHLFNGISLMASSLQWLRSNGIDIQTFCGHTSAPVCGFEDFEIFEGLARPGADRAEMKRYGGHYYVPLGQLDMADFGLKMDANRPVPRKQALREQWELKTFASKPDVYLREYRLFNPHFEFDWDVEAFFHQGGVFSIVDKTKPTTAYLSPVPMEMFVRYLETLPGGTRVCANIHPDHIALADHGIKTRFA